MASTVAISKSIKKKPATEADLIKAVHATLPASKREKLAKAAKRDLKAAGFITKSKKPKAEPVDAAAIQARVLAGFSESPDPAQRAMFREVFPGIWDVPRQPAVVKSDRFNADAYFMFGGNPVFRDLYEKAVHSPLGFRLSVANPGEPHEIRAGQAVSVASDVYPKGR